MAGERAFRWGKLFGAMSELCNDISLYGRVNLRSAKPVGEPFERENERIGGNENNDADDDDNSDDGPKTYF